MPTKRNDKQNIPIIVALITTAGVVIAALLTSFFSIQSSMIESDARATAAEAERMLTVFANRNTQIATSNLSTPTPTTSPIDIKLIPTGDKYIAVELDGYTLSNGDVIPLKQTITVTFSIVNNGSSPASIKTLVIGARGPGVSCQNSTTAKWSAPDNPFPAKTNLIVQPGEEYKYQGSRAFYIPGDYFLEPNIEDSNGHWGGIEPFSCIGITVK